MTDIVVAGLGIKFYSHLTQEVIAAIRGAEKLFYLANEPVMSEWLESEGNNPSSLDSIYFSKEKRYDSYKEISSEIIKSTNLYESICFAIYGHPLMLNHITEYIISDSSPSINVSLLPGISSESAMFCDLAIDPLRHGLQSYEATKFLYGDIPINTEANLVLWQAGVIGVQGHTAGHDPSLGLTRLREKIISKGYDKERTIYFYESSLYPHKPPNIIKSTVEKMDKYNISTLMTLFIPAL